VVARHHPPPQNTCQCLLTFLRGLTQLAPCSPQESFFNQPLFLRNKEIFAHILGHRWEVVGIDSAIFFTGDLLFWLPRLPFFISGFRIYTSINSACWVFSGHRNPARPFLSVSPGVNYHSCFDKDRSNTFLDDRSKLYQKCVVSILPIVIRLGYPSPMTPKSPSGVKPIIVFLGGTSQISHFNNYVDLVEGPPPEPSLRSRKSFSFPLIAL